MRPEEANRLTDQFLRMVAANAIRSGELEMPQGKSTIQKVRSLDKQEVILNIESVPVASGKLEATVELVELQRETPPVALIHFGGSYSSMMELPEKGYTRHYGAIIDALSNGNYKLEINPRGELSISFSDLEKK